MSIVVVKGGGLVTAQTAGCALALWDAGHRVCVVHGAGPQISTEMDKLGLQVNFVDGRRVTTPEGLAVVRESMTVVNRAICLAIGPRAVGLMGEEIGLEADHVAELGLVGEARPSSPEPVVAALAENLIPVVTPLARGPLNVNADEAAAALAAGLGAAQLTFVVDVPGVFVDGSVAPALSTETTHRLLGEGVFEGGIVPKLHAALSAARLGIDVRIGQTRVLPAAV